MTPFRAAASWLAYRKLDHTLKISRARAHVRNARAHAHGLFY